MEKRLVNNISKGLFREIIKKSLILFIIFGLLSFVYCIYLFKFKGAISSEFINLIDKTVLIAFVLFIALWLKVLSVTIFNWYLVNIAKKTKSRLDDEFIPLLRRFTNIIIWIIALLVILSNLGINISALVATLGISSLAIALAAQDTIANIIAGFLIMVDRPFSIDDEIKLPSGEKVKVLDIGIRRSKFLNLEDNAIIIVPNLDLSKSKIINYTYGKEMR